MQIPFQASLLAASVVDIENQDISCLTTASYSAVALENGAILSDEDFIKEIEKYIKRI